MAEPLVTRRLVYHLGGYDPVAPQAAYQRFVRELRRFTATWSVMATASAPIIEADVASWHVAASGPNWRAEIEYRLMRWDDVIEAAGRQPMWRRVPSALFAFLDFVAAGALWGYFRTNWRYAGFFLYPFVLFGLLAALAGGAGTLVTRTTESPIIGLCAGLAALVLLMRWPAERLFLPLLFDDWIFSRDYIRRRDAVLDPRLDRIARALAASVRDGEADEIVVIGHSLGAVLAVDCLARALRLDPGLGKTGPRVSLLSVGSSLLKIGLHRRATRFRNAVEHVASAPQIFWAEYQALTDVMNFYKSNPVADMGLRVPGRPVVRVERIRRMVDPARYRRIRRNFFKIHCQFVNGNDRRAAYDYFMLLCGPLSVERQVRYADGAVSAIGADGALRESAADVPHVLGNPVEMSR
ncbi:hypothetical protein [Microvirga alba]|uniref:Alpha/beta hydrolase n=1 Tax=Microvirga alba TaxID=2791025 RepID=A0A931BR93_9HYPH|nr:hypothetical protein [Microvirga alba]MBF9232285.1 hypothetical protein [Microvirga alba]